MKDWRKYHICPNCGKKKLFYAAHPHAFGWKDFEKAWCRVCGAIYSTRGENGALIKIGSRKV